MIEGDFMRVLMIKLSPIEGLNSSTIRALSLAKGFEELGHKIDYITIPISSTHVKMEKKSLEQKINIIKTKPNEQYETVISKGKKGFVHRVITKILRKVYHKITIYNYTYSIAKSMDISLLNNPNYDLVISISDPKTSHIAMEKLIAERLKYKKWIQYWGDPMTVDITSKSIYPSKYIKKKELSLLKNADAIVYVSPFTLKVQEKLFPQLAKKMHFLPVPYYESKIYGETENLKYTIGYFGAYNSKIRNINPLYQCCAKLSETVDLIIVGDSDLKLKEKENIEIHPRGDISFFEEKVDLLVCMLNNKGTQIPGKVYHYAATNKPILIILDGQNKREMKEYFKSFGRYYICDNKISSIMEKIKEIINDNVEFEPSKEFSPKLIASQFIKLHNID